MKAWEVDLIVAQADETTWQSSIMTKADTDTYQGQILERLNSSKAVLISYEEHKTVYLVNFLNDFVGEFHVFSDGGTWGLVESFRKFQQDVWGRCLQMRIETRVRKPVLQAILKRCGVPVEGVRRKAWYDSGTCQMLDENVYALHRHMMQPLATPSAALVEAFDQNLASLAVAMVRDCDLITPAVRHFFIADTYVRETATKKGTCVIGYKHNYDHIVILSGDTIIKDATGTHHFMGPHNTFRSAAGAQRIGYAIQDTICTTVHRLPDPNERDIKKIEAYLYSGNQSELKQRYLMNQTKGLVP